jgi:glycosyltransferase involved in cell wall biosynthesis
MKGAPEMRISLVTETYFPQINGVSRTLDRLVNSLREQGDEIQLLIPRYRDQGEPLPDDLTVVGFPAVALPFYREILLPVVTPGTIRRQLQSFTPDLVHIATEGPLGWAALRAARKLGLPTVSSFHTLFPAYLGSYGLGCLAPLAWRYLRWLHNATAATFCPTPSISELLEYRGFRNLQIWGRGVDSSRFHPAKRDVELRRQLGFGDDETVFLYAGRLAAEKNLPMLTEAIERIDRPDVRLLLIGDGPLRKQLENRRDPRLVFTGYRRGEELARLYAVADVMVFPSLTDTFGNVMLEAMASGLPVLGFQVPGPRDVIRDGVTGELVGEVSASALAGTMQQWLKGAIDLAYFSIRARREAESKSWSAINATVRNTYLQLCGTDGEPGVAKDSVAVKTC